MIADSALPNKKVAQGISIQALVKFFLPTLAIWLIGPSLSLIDTAVVGSKSSTQLAALGPGCILCDCNGYFFTFLAVASKSRQKALKVLLLIPWIRHAKSNRGPALI